MIVNRDSAVSYIFDDEGDEFNVSADEPGGASKLGVSLVALAEYCHVKDLPKPSIADVGALTRVTAAPIYLEKFADPLRFNDLPQGIDYRMLDAAATLGVTGACLVTQMSLAMWPITGVMDDTTIAAIRRCDAWSLLLALDAAWLVWKHGMTQDGWKKYGHGWTNRVIKVRDRTVAMIGAKS